MSEPVQLFSTAAKQSASLAKQVAGVIREHVGKAFRALADRIDVVERRAAERIETVERRLEAVEVAQKAIPHVSYKGIWTEGQNYPRGSLATHGGSLWYTDAPTNAKPGEAGEPWRLVAKKGRDGRDAR